MKKPFQVKADVVLYVLKKCSDAVKKSSCNIGSQTVFVVKLTNITSSRRHIIAVYNSHTFSKQKSLLKPSHADSYFHAPSALNAGVEAFGDFNDAQTRVIQYAEEIFHSNDTGRLRLVHGPPGPIHMLSHGCMKNCKTSFI